MKKNRRLISRFYYGSNHRRRWRRVHFDPDFFSIRHPNIETIVGIEGAIGEVIDTYLKGELKSGESTCKHTGFGHEIGHHGCEK